MAALFWTMAVGGAAIWLGVIALLLHAVQQRRSAFSERFAGRLVFWGGAVFPSAVLVLLLGYALWLMPGLRPWASAAPGTLRVAVTGEQFWWRVTYRRSDGTTVASANEIRLPVGERVDFELTSTDVIHSFWIPSLGGKMDIIPGRTNRLSLLATKAGTFRGPCAEYCGTSHALMAFTAVAMEPDEFRQWLDRRAASSAGAGAPGGTVFMRHGCGACHAVLGTEARGGVGPDLSHLGSRETLAAGILPNTQEAIARFIADPQAAKPGARMPSFAMLPQADIDAMAVYLKGLQ